MTKASGTVTRPSAAEEDVRELMEKLTDRRAQLGLNRTLVAWRMGTHESVLSALESQSRTPTVKTLRRWAHSLGMEVAFRLCPRSEHTEPPALRLFELSDDPPSGIVP